MHSKSKTRLKHAGCLWLFFLILITPVPGEQNTPSHDQATCEILVRVFSRNRPVDHLTRDDFTVHQNGKSPTISGFQLHREKMSARLQKTSSSPLLILICDIFDFNQDVQSSLRYLFDSILGNQGRLMIQINNHLIFFNQIQPAELIRKKAMEWIRQQSQAAEQRASDDLKKMNAFITYLRKNTQRTAGNDEDYRSGEGKIHRHYYMKYFKSFLEQYLKALQGYIREYVNPRLDSMQNLLAHVRKSRPEPWVFHLYQKPGFPRLSKKNRAIITKMKNDLDDRDWTAVWMDELDYSKKINKLLGAIDQTLGIPSDYNPQPFIDLLYEWNIRFHSLYLARGGNSQPKPPEDTGKHDNMNRPWEQISSQTGGCFLDLENSPDSIERVMEHEDIYYSLRFLSRDNIISSPVRVGTRNPKYHVRTGQLKNGEKQKTTPSTEDHIRITRGELNNKKLTFSIGNFQTKIESHRTQGKMNIHIQILNSRDQRIFDSSKILTTERNTIQISIGFPTPLPGNIRAIIEVTDLNSRHTAIDVLKQNP